MNISEMQLLAGLPIKIEGVCQIHPLKLIEIVDMGESLYQEQLQWLCLDINNLVDADQIKDAGYEAFDIIAMSCQYNEEFCDFIKSAFKTFLRENIDFSPISNIFYVGDIQQKRIIDADVYEQIKTILIKQNCLIVQREEEYNPANEKARKFIEKIRKRKAKAPPSKSNIDLASIISGVAWKANSINIFNIFNLTVFQLYDAYHRLETVDNYNITMQGMTFGTIEQSKIDWKKVSWVQKISMNK